MELKIIIDNVEYQAKPNETILEVARRNNIDIPTLCFLKGVNEPASCRVCVVEVEGARNLCTACSTKVRDGMVVKTNTKKVIDARRNALELLLSNHNKKCLSCLRNLNCDLQRLTEQFNCDAAKYEGETTTSSIDDSNHAIVRDPSKCILCGKCIAVCSKSQGCHAIGKINRGFETKVGVAFDDVMQNSTCVGCGQCTLVCPTAALTVKSNINEVLEILDKKDVIKVAQVAPAVRVSIAEAFGAKIGTFAEGKLVSALKKCGFDYVFDVNNGADFTVIEEANELIEKLQTGKGLPLFTSCCPAWVKFVETFYPQYIPNLSSCKSPISMLSSMVKNYFANEKNIDPKNIYLVAVTPCVAKKFEIKRPELSEFYGRDTDLVITAREMARLLKKQKINLKAQKDSEFDEFFPTGSGAGVIFGTSGGVMEAAVRTAYYMTTGENPPKDLLHFKKLRGYTDIKTAKVNLCGKEVKLCVIFGTNAARSVLDKLKTKNYDMIEVMACPNGCVGGGGQPKQYDNDTAVTKRGDALYNADENMSVKSCHENESIQRVYQNFLTSPLSDKAKKYLHTTYVKR